MFRPKPKALKLPGPTFSSAQPESPQLALALARAWFSGWVVRQVRMKSAAAAFGASRTLAKPFPPRTLLPAVPDLLSGGAPA
ncbi:MAG TPA: hypothetical protein VH137_09680 [Gemmatimonadales bacterium]|nr:hypothetical protein [Gemmatimonadales bacterium]